MQKAIRELEEIIGLGGAFLIVRRFAGRRIRIPTRVDPLHPMTLVLGTEITALLVAKKGGEDMDIPIERNALMGIRNDLIWVACQVKKRSHTEVALEFGLSRTAVSDIIRKMKELKALRKTFEGRTLVRVLL